VKPGQVELGVRDVRIGDELCVWWGDGWARIVSMALREEGDIAVLFEDGTADVVLDIVERGGCHVVREPRGTGLSVGEILDGKKANG